MPVTGGAWSTATADVPTVAADGRPALVRVTLRYLEPALVVERAPAGTAATVARRVRGAVAAAGYVYPVRKVTAGGWWADRPATTFRRGAERPAPGEPAPWEDGWRLAAAVGLLVASGQVLADDVPAAPMVGAIDNRAALVAAGLRRLDTRRRVTWPAVEIALGEYDRGTAALVALERRRAGARRSRLEGVVGLRRAGLTVREIARLTGLGDQRVDTMLRSEGASAYGDT